MQSIAQALLGNTVLKELVLCDNTIGAVGVVVAAFAGATPVAVAAVAVAVRCCCSLLLFAVAVVVVVAVAVAVVVAVVVVVGTLIVGYWPHIHDGKGIRSRTPGLLSLD